MDSSKFLIELETRPLQEVQQIRDRAVEVFRRRALISGTGITDPILRTKDELKRDEIRCNMWRQQAVWCKFSSKPTEQPSFGDLDLATASLFRRPDVVLFEKSMNEAIEKQVKSTALSAAIGKSQTVSKQAEQFHGQEEYKQANVSPPELRLPRSENAHFTGGRATDQSFSVPRNPPFQAHNPTHSTIHNTTNSIPTHLPHPDKHYPNLHYTSGASGTAPGPAATAEQAASREHQRRIDAAAEQTRQRRLTLHNSAHNPSHQQEQRQGNGQNSLPPGPVMNTSASSGAPHAYMNSHNLQTFTHGQSNGNGPHSYHANTNGRTNTAGPAYANPTSHAHSNNQTNNHTNGHNNSYTNGNGYGNKRTWESANTPTHPHPYTNTTAQNTASFQRTPTPTPYAGKPRSTRF